MTPDDFTRLSAYFAQIDLFGNGPPGVPWNARNPPTVDRLVGCIRKAADILPRAYRDTYVAALLREAPSIVAQYGDKLSPILVEAMTGAVYDHDWATGVVPEVRRFLAVVSDLYRSFLSARRRTKIAAPVIAQLPPLVVFQSSGALGPFTIPCDEMDRLLGTSVGVVSLPSSYRSHPVLWSALAHETGGHDVTHADPNLLLELSAEVQRMFGGSSFHGVAELSPMQVLALVWSYWIDEATADIFGVLNAGPALVANLAAFFAAINRRVNADVPFPGLRMRSGALRSGALDPHPTEILRIYLGIGAIEALWMLSSDVRRRYVSELEAIAKLCAQGETEIDLAGDLPFRDTRIQIRRRVALAEWAQAARQVGGLVVTTRLNALGNNRIQEIETWDDVDEGIVERVREGLLHDQAVANIANDAQLLSGATLALLSDITAYDRVVARVNEALDASFRTDELWGVVSPKIMCSQEGFTRP
jgi:hypothetical protein